MICMECRLKMISGFTMVEETVTQIKSFELNKDA